MTHQVMIGSRTDSADRPDLRCRTKFIGRSEYRSANLRAGDGWMKYGNSAVLQWRRDCPRAHTGTVTSSDSARKQHHFLRSVIRWLQVGYPQGVPGPDQVPLFALLRGTPLTEEQIAEVVANLTATGAVTATDGVIDGNHIAETIAALTDHSADADNVRRVAATLAAAGWPLAGIDVSEVIPGDEDGEAAEEIASAPRFPSQG